jgi:selenocysteine lyase/cysteine desulfurase
MRTKFGPKATAPLYPELFRNSPLLRASPHFINNKIEIANLLRFDFEKG